MFAVLGLGKLGSREMTFDSDLDVVFVYGAPKGVDVQSDGTQGLAASHYYTRFSQRLTHALSAHTAEGRLYEIDTRLRPSGDSGPLATEAAAFRRYHEEDAWTWEHMALTRARPVAGDRELCALVMEGIRSVLCTPATLIPCSPTSPRCASGGRQRTPNREHVAPQTCAGGVLDLEFIAQYHPAASRRGASFDCRSIDAAAYGGWERRRARRRRRGRTRRDRRLPPTLQGLLRLTVGTNRDVERFTARVRQTLARAMGMENFPPLRPGSSLARIVSAARTNA